MLKIGTVLAAKLEEKNMTQKEIAKQLSVSPGAFSAYVNDTNFPRLDVLVDICQILDIDLNHLLGLKSHQNKDLLIQGKDEAKIISYLRGLSQVEHTYFMESICFMMKMMDKIKNMEDEDEEE